MVVYGDVRGLTRQSGNMMGATDRISRLVGNGSHCLDQLKTGADLGGDEGC